MKLLEEAGDYDPAPCPLPECGKPLHFTYSASQYLYASFTEEDLRGCRGDEFTSWEIRCEAGHVILLPLDNGDENHEFGVCRCDPADVAVDGHAEPCPQDDFARLR